MGGVRIVNVLLLHLCFAGLCFSADTAAAGNVFRSPPPPPSEKVQLAYLMYAYASFCPVGLANWTCFWCKHLPWVKNVTVSHVIETDGIEGIFGFVGHTTDVESDRPLVIVSFRGTASLDNWETDLELWENQFPEAPGAKIHHGFYSAWLNVKEQVVSHVKALVSKLSASSGVKPKILNTGHSLGAAMSAISSFELAIAGLGDLAEIELVNYGQPRIGNKALAAYAEQQVARRYRVVNHKDIVPHYPPMSLDYYHTTQELWYKTSNSTFVTCSSTNGEDPACSDSECDILEKPWGCSRADHELYLGINQGIDKGHGCD